MMLHFFLAHRTLSNFKLFQEEEKEAESESDGGEGEDIVAPLPTKKDDLSKFKKSAKDVEEEEDSDDSDWASDDDDESR